MSKALPVGLPVVTPRLGAVAKQVEDLLRRLGDDGAGTKDGGDAVGIELVVVLRRDDSAGDDQDVAAPAFRQRLLEGRDQGQVPGGERAGADHVHVVIDGLLRRLFRGLEEGADVDVEAEIGKARGDDLLTAVMTVLAELGDQDARPAPFTLEELLDLAAHLLDGAFAVTHLPRVDAGDHPRLGLEASEHFLQREADLADRRLARAALMERSSRLPSLSLAHFVRASRAAATAPESRVERSSFSRLIWFSRTAVLSIVSTRIGLSWAGRYLLSPTMVCRPESISAWVRAAASAMRILGRPASIALVMPPCSSHSTICAEALRASSWVSHST